MLAKFSLGVTTTMSELVPVRIADARPVAGFRVLRRGKPEPIAVPQPAMRNEPPEDPFEEGYRRGQKDAEQSFAKERARFRAVIAACDAFQPEPSEALALLIAESVEMLVRVTVGDVSIDSATLLSRAQRAAALAGDVDATRLLHLHPDDLALVGQDNLPLAAVADASITPGSLRIDHPTGSIEDGVAVHLEALREQLGLKEQAE